LILVCWLPAGCGPKPNEVKQGQITLRWDGPLEGGLSGPAKADWCPALRLLEIQSIHGDTGVALALYPVDTVGPGSYRIVEPVRAESFPPAASIAVRWLSRNVVQGFQGDSGQLDLERSAAGQLSGRVHARARSVVDTQQIALTGTFQGLRPLTDSLRCSPEDTNPENFERDETTEPDPTDVD
jgi:hypothetical protein